MFFYLQNLTICNKHANKFFFSVKCFYLYIRAYSLHQIQLISVKFVPVIIFIWLTSIAVNIWRPPSCSVQCNMWRDINIKVNSNELQPYKLQKEFFLKIWFRSHIGALDNLTSFVRFLFRFPICWNVAKSQLFFGVVRFFIILNCKCNQILGFSDSPTT